jgi:hypothetical protein
VATELGKGVGQGLGGVPSRATDSVAERQRMAQEGQETISWPSIIFTTHVRMWIANILASDLAHRCRFRVSRKKNETGILHDDGSSDAVAWPLAFLLIDHRIALTPPLFRNSFR